VCEYPEVADIAEVLRRPFLPDSIASGATMGAKTFLELFPGNPGIAALIYNGEKRDSEIMRLEAK
jgi:hypothetical protein